MKKFLFGLAPLMAVAMFALAPSTALATEHHPKGAFAPFAECPLSNPAVEACVVAVSKSGEFLVGKKTTPITKPITLQGGFRVNPTTGEQEFYGAENGETLSNTPQTVPGGLFGIVAPKSWPKAAQEWFNKLINEGFTGVTETTELAAPASAIKLSSPNLLFEEGVALQLPVKVKLSNVLLGSSCYLGSESDPIVLKLTTGTTSPPEPNKPIKGSAGKLEVLEHETLLRLIGGSLVDNSFAAPEVTGCGGIFSALVDPLVDSIFGVPSAAGHNTTILNGNLEQGAAEAVRASE
ncbi:MAG: hypothetical protein ACLQMH_08730 [Solirubrobacteraceae bacterium]